MNYFFDWSGLEDFSEYTYDSNGIPLAQYKPPIGFQYNPITIAQFGLDQFNRFQKSASAENRDNILKAATWLAENYEENSTGGAVWFYHFDLDFYPIKAPWISAMAQGEAISLLLRAASLGNHQKFAEVAERAVIPFQFPIEAGGVCAQFANGALSLEEYPSYPPSHVLNGAIFALFGLYDFLQVRSDSKISEILQTGIQGLSVNLPQYDTGFWSRYDLFPKKRLASPDYHKIHIQLLTSLALISGVPVFQETALRWQDYAESPACRVRWAASKIWEKWRLARSRRNENNSKCKTGE